MKIILEALKVLRSQPMDVPENTTPYFKMALNQPPTAIHGYDGGKIAEVKSIFTTCTFEWTGMWEGDAKVYVLCSIDTH